MINERMEELRSKINFMMLSEEGCYGSLLKVSQELDKLIVESLRAQLELWKAKNNLPDNNIDLQPIIEKLKFFNKRYQALRIVDPILKQVHYYSEQNNQAKKGPCYELWGKKQFCENCVAIKAYERDDYFVKVEHSDDDVFMIIAVPVEHEGKRLVVELLKNISDENIVYNSTEEDGLVKLIDDISKLKSL